MELNRRVCRAFWLGRMEYGRSLELQRALAAERSLERVPDSLLLLEHPPTYTLGKRGDEANLLVSRLALERQGVELHRVDRGGDITFHGPGQLVGYPVVSLEGREGGASRYMRGLEEVIIRLLSTYGVEAGRMPKYTGVWVGGEKIAAIGVKIDAKRITGHGFALNVTTDLGYFGQIVPCGIKSKGVTSLERVIGRPVALEEVARALVPAFADVFDFDEMPEGRPDDLLALMERQSASVPR